MVREFYEEKKDQVEEVEKRKQPFLLCLHFFFFSGSSVFFIDFCFGFSFSFGFWLSVSLPVSSFISLFIYLFFSGSLVFFISFFIGSCFCLSFCFPASVSISDSFLGFPVYCYVFFFFFCWGSVLVYFVFCFSFILRFEYYQICHKRNIRMLQRNTSVARYKYQISLCTSLPAEKLDHIAFLHFFLKHFVTLFLH